MTTVSNAFVPVSDPGQAAEWYSEHLMLRVVTISEWSAVLTGDGGATVTLMGPLSGIAAEPGLAWSTCGFLVEDLTSMRDRLLRNGHGVSVVEGDPDTCLFFTVRDLDGNVLLLTDR